MGRDIKAGLAFIEVVIDNRKVASGLATSRRMLLDFSIFASGIRDKLSPARFFKGLGEGMQKFGRASLIRGGLIAAALVPIIKVASDARETANKFKAVFQGDAGNIGRWVVTLADRIGRSKTELKDSLSMYQAFFKGLEFGGKEASKMSRKMQEASLDFASFFNISDKEASGRFISALSGSSEVLDRFGINIKIAALQAELAAMGIDSAWSDVTEPQKVMARINIILKSMKLQGALGDAFTTRGEFANLLKRIAGAAKDAAAAIGKALLPVLTPLASHFAGLLSRFAEWAKVNQRMIRNIATLGVRFLAFGLALIVVGKAASMFGVLLSVAFALVKIGIVVKLVAPFLPMLFGLAKALSLVSIGTTALTTAFAGLKIVAAAVLPMMIKVTLAIGGLSLAVGLLAAVWINAEIQGITFGQSVLDLMNRILGLKNAFTSLRDEQNRSVKQRRLEGGDLFNRPADDFGFKEHKEEALAVRKRLLSERALATEKLALIEGDRERRAGQRQRGIELPEGRERNLFEKFRLEEDLKGFDKAIADAKNRIAVIGARLISTDALLTRIDESPRGGVESKGAKGAGLSIDALFEVLLARGAAERALRAPLETARLQGIVDPEKRQIAIAKHEFAGKRVDFRAGRAAFFHELSELQKIEDPEKREKAIKRHDKAGAGFRGDKAFFLRKEEEQTIKNIQDKFARERAEDNQRKIEERLRQEQELAREIERLEINNSLKGRKRTMALLALQEKHALKGAGDSERRLVRAKFALLREGGVQDVSREIRGTFSATAVAGLGQGGPVQRAAKAAELIAKQGAELLKIDKEILAVEKMHNHQATA